MVGSIPGIAADPPHWLSANTYEDCNSSCHAIHSAIGGTLTQSAANVTLCQSCHNPSGAASAMPINNSDKAVPGVVGTSHAFDVSATNPTYGAALPTNQAMALRVMGGNIVCSTCHDQHKAVSTPGGTSHISAALRITALGSTGSIVSGGTYTGAAGSWYLVDIQSAGNESTALFRYSKDNGSTWMASGISAGTGVPLDSGVTVSFGVGNYVVGERWQFYGSWPFLRAAIDSGDAATGTLFCRDCHNAWTMTAADVETYDGTSKGHPTGLPLGFGGRAYDRAVPLDGNGAVQGSGGADTNATNDLALDATARLQCLSCHNPHFADGNTLTQDGP